MNYTYASFDLNLSSPEGLGVPLKLRKRLLSALLEAMPESVEVELVLVEHTGPCDYGACGKSEEHLDRHDR